MKRAGIIIFVFLMFVICGMSVSAAAVHDNASELILLHTNDHHGAVLPSDGRGGLAETASYINAVRKTNKQVLLLDAGDINTGSALSNMFSAEIDLLAYNMMKYDAVVLGNHEFDGSLLKLEQQIAMADFPFVCSNIETASALSGVQRYIVKQYDGFSVGIFGITTLRTLTIANPDKSLCFINEIEASKNMVDILRNRERVDIVIGLTHMGDVKESADHITSTELAQSVPGIDIIVDGHSHSFMETPIKSGLTWIVSANEWGKYAGHGKLVIRNGRLADFEWKPVAIGPDRAVAEMIRPYAKKADESLKEVIGTAAEDFIFGSRLPRYGETSVGNLITDANFWYFTEVQNHDIDFVFHNGGNIRSGICGGDITRENILTVLPFENYLYIASLSGSDIIGLFDFIAGIPQGNGGFPQFSKEVRYTVDKQAGGSITQLSIGGLPVIPDKIYRFCTNDYLLGGGDGYTVLEKSFDRFNTSRLLSDVVIEYIKSRGAPLLPVIDGRLTVTGGTEP